MNFRNRFRSLSDVVVKRHKFEEREREREREMRERERDLLFSMLNCRSWWRAFSAATFRSPWMFRSRVSMDEMLGISPFWSWDWNEPTWGVTLSPRSLVFRESLPAKLSSKSERKINQIHMDNKCDKCLIQKNMYKYHLQCANSNSSHTIKTKYQV